MSRQHQQDLIQWGAEWGDVNGWVRRHEGLTGVKEGETGAAAWRRLGERERGVRRREGEREREKESENVIRVISGFLFLVIRVIF